MGETLIDEVFEKANGIRERWPYLPDNRFRWRMDRRHFDAIWRASFPPSFAEGLDDLPHPGFAELAAEARRERAEREALHRDAWGKPDNTLLGWPIVCDETMPGFEPEVMLRETVAP